MSRLTAAIVGAVACISLSLFAQPASGADKKAAKTHFDNGLSMMELEDFVGAAVEFEASLEKYPTKNAMFNLGMCYKALHRYPQALEVFRRVLKKFGSKLDDEMRSEVRKNISAINKMIADVEIQTNVPDVIVLVDGIQVGVTPLTDPLVLGAGEHRVKASKAGYKDQEKVVSVAAMSHEVVRFDMEELPAGAAVGAPMGSRSLKPNSGAQAPPPLTPGSAERPPVGSLPPPPPPAVPTTIPRERVGRNMFGIGVAVQAAGMAVGLATHYGNGLDTDTIPAAALYYLGTTAVSGVANWGYSHKSNYYDYPIWLSYIGSVVGGGMGFAISGTIVYYTDDGSDGLSDSSDDDAQNELAGLMMAYAVALFIPSAVEALTYRIFKRPKPRYRDRAATNMESHDLKETKVAWTLPAVYALPSMDGSGARLGIHLLGANF